MNLYAFVGNNPVNFTDPFGLCSEQSGLDPLAKAYGIAGGADLIGLGTAIAIGGFVETGGLSIIGALPFWIGGGALIWASTDGGLGSSGGSSSGGTPSGGSFQDAVDDYNYYNSGTPEATSDLMDAIGGGF